MINNANQMMQRYKDQISLDWSNYAILSDRQMLNDLGQRIRANN